MNKHNIQFPKIDASHLDQDEAFFYLKTGDETEKILLHEYGKIYDIPGLYEQLFYERLKCCSPQKVADALKYAIEINNEYFSTMKVLDFGAGNGMIGEELKKSGLPDLSVWIFSKKQKTQPKETGLVSMMSITLKILQI